MRRLYLAAIGALFLQAGAALANQPVIYSPQTRAQASAAVHRGPHVASANADYRNGSVDAVNTFGAPGATIAGGGSSPGTTFADAAITGGSGERTFTAEAHSIADLATGTLKAWTATTGGENFGTPSGGALAQLQDTLFFNNTSGAAQIATLTMRFDGAMVNPFASNPGGSLGFSLLCFSSNCYNGEGTGDRIVFANTGHAISGGWNYYFSYNGSCFGENIFCGQGGAADWMSNASTPGFGPLVDGYISTSILVPTGETSIGLAAYLSLDCRGGSSCDFGHTSAFSFDALPSGLSFSSASGLFLTANQATGAVPEPATWAMMIGGFGMIGGAMRRRKGLALATAA